MRPTTPTAPNLLAAIAIASTALLAACQPGTPATDDATAPTATAPAPAPASTAPTSAAPPAPAPPPRFAGKVWRAAAGGPVEPGTTYAFLDDGTLVIDSPSGTPMVGAWAQADGRMTMTEEGITYPVDVLQLDDSTFRLRSNNPGGAVEITLEAAPDVALPVAPAK
jgi:hypothetical protein